MTFSYEAPFSPPSFDTHSSCVGDHNRNFPQSVPRLLLYRALSVLTTGEGPDNEQLLMSYRFVHNRLSVSVVSVSA